MFGASSANTRVDPFLLAKIGLSAPMSSPSPFQAVQQGAASLAYANITPFGYKTPSLSALFTGKDRKSTAPATEDAWRLYLGLPQLNNSFRPSNYVPSERPKNKRGSTYFSAPDLERQIIDSESIKTIVKNLGGNQRLQARDDKSEVGGLGDWYETLNRFQFSKGKDKKGSYIAYYDIWDLNHPLAKLARIAGVGKPFEIYGRIYYDPVTFKPKGPAIE